VALRTLEYEQASIRRPAIEAMFRLNDERRFRSDFINAAKRFSLAKPRSRARASIYAIAVVSSEFKDEALTVLADERIRVAMEGEQDDETVNFLGLGVSLQYELARYRDVVASARLCTLKAPAALRSRYDYLKAAYAAGKLRREEDAVEFFGRQFRLIDDHGGHATQRELKRVHKAYQATALRVLQRDPELASFIEKEQGTCAVFFLSSTEALGHAILDPYFFVAQNKDKYDRLIFIGPPKASYRPASRACLQIVEQYGDYHEVQDDDLLNLSWMSFGHHTSGKLTFVIDHYWALLRNAVHRSRDKSDAFDHNRWHFALPEYYGEITQAFARSHGLDLSKPMVVLHVRDKGYHGIAMQSYRDSAIANYHDSVEHLLSLGLQVVRIGDRSMPRLNVTAKGYFELPFLSGYTHEIDPFLIAQSYFMIGCQSGPCAFARVLGVPVLTVNAVLHYTLLPTSKEMACFKRYFETVGGVKRELSIEEALARGCHHFDNTFQYEKAGISVENALPQEITAAVADMVAWLKRPDLPETAEQLRFRKEVEDVARDLERRGRDLDLPIADYIGICLPEYRISPTVARMRAGETKDAGIVAMENRQMRYGSERR
jgi:putative glycosyltransferase (TIGR04372 family)